MRHSLEQLKKGALLDVYLRCSKLVQAPGPKEKKSAREGKRVKTTLGKRKRMEAEEEENSGEENGEEKDSDEDDEEEENEEYEENEEAGEER